jgi:post-segregation antitoxin (ccd killing protein)
LLICNFKEGVKLGRNRLLEGEKRVRLSITLPRELIDQVKNKEWNLSRMIEEYLKKMLEKENSSCK